MFGPFPTLRRIKPNDIIENNTEALVDWNLSLRGSHDHDQDRITEKNVAPLHQIMIEFDVFFLKLRLYYVALVDNLIQKKFADKPRDRKSFFVACLKAAQRLVCVTDRWLVVWFCCLSLTSNALWENRILLPYGVCSKVARTSSAWFHLEVQRPRSFLCRRSESCNCLRQNNSPLGVGHKPQSFALSTAGKKKDPAIVSEVINTSQKVGIFHNFEALECIPETLLVK